MTKLKTINEFNENLIKVIDKIKICHDYGTLHQLNEDFNSIGLALVKTVSNKMILCKIKENKPCVDKILQDYIFVGSVNEHKNELSNKFVSCLIEFIKKSNSNQSFIKYEDKNWQKMFGQYGKAVGIQMESVDMKIQEIAEKKVIKG